MNPSPGGATLRPRPRPRNLPRGPGAPFLLAEPASLRSLLFPARSFFLAKNILGGELASRPGAGKSAPTRASKCTFGCLR